jgi:hypothetical protein
VGKNPGDPLGPETFPVGEDWMCAQRQWTGSARIPGQPQIRRCRIGHASNTAVGRDDETLETWGGTRQHTNRRLPELTSSAEPAPELCASIETITPRRHADRRCGRPKDATFVPPVDTTTDLPPNDSVRPIGNVELQRIVKDR